MSHHLLTETGAARLLALTTAQVRRLVAAGAVPVVELPNGEVRFDAEDLRRWAGNFRRQPVICRPARGTLTR